MLIAYTQLFENHSFVPHLCIIPHTIGDTIHPTKVSSLRHTAGAVFWVGPGESIKVEEIPSERAKVIAAIRPAIMYITASTQDQPGTKVSSVKVIYGEDGLEKIMFPAANGEWKDFSALEQR